MSDYTNRGEAERPAWSGYWWPMLTNRDREDYRNLYEEGGPLDKYDEYCVAVGLPNPRSRDFEAWRHFADRRTEEATGHKAFWWGHCNGWAAASVLEPEPKASKTAQGIAFAVGDLKGLLTVVHNGDPVDIIRGLGDREAHLFHSTILQSIGVDRRGLIFDTKLDPIDPQTKKPVREVWNYPAYRYECEYKEVAGQAQTFDVTMKVWFADDGVWPDFVGTKNWPTDGKPKVYTYRISGDKANPVSGYWTSASTQDHPDLMWRPQPLSVQNAAEEQDPGGSQTNFHPTLRPIVYAIREGQSIKPSDAVQRKLKSLDLHWQITPEEQASFPPPLAPGDWWRYKVSHKDTIGEWTRPFLLHVEVVGWDGDDWVFEVGAVHQGDVIPERHVIYYRKDTRLLSENAPHPGGYAYTLLQDKDTRAFKRTVSPALWENSPLRRLLSVLPYHWDRAGAEPIEKVRLGALGRDEIPARQLPVGIGAQLWADHTVSHPRGNIRGMFLVAELDRIHAELVDFGHKDAQ
jgi:hypothetical protein